MSVQTSNPYVFKRVSALYLVFTHDLRVKRAWCRVTEAINVFPTECFCKRWTLLGLPETKSVISFTQDQAVCSNSVGTFLTFATMVRRKHIDPVQKHPVSISASPTFCWSPFEGVSFITILQINLFSALTTKSATGSNYYITHTKRNCSSDRCIHPLLITSRWRSVLPIQTTVKVNCKLHSHYVYLPRRADYSYLQC